MRIFIFALLFISLVGAGCRRPPPPPQPPPPPPAAPPPAPPPPPPPPKCESLQEYCVAAAATLLAVGDKGAVLSPPVGWKYAHAPDGSIAVNGDGKAVLYAVTAPSSKPEDLAPVIEAATTKLQITGVKMDGLKKRLKKPDSEIPEKALKLWEVSKKSLSQLFKPPELTGQGKGTLLVAVAEFAPDHVVVVLGFVVEPDAQAEAQNIMQAVQSLKGAK